MISLSAFALASHVQDSGQSVMHFRKKEIMAEPITTLQGQQHNTEAYRRTKDMLLAHSCNQIRIFSSNIWVSDMHGVQKYSNQLFRFR